MVLKRVLMPAAAIALVGSIGLAAPASAKLPKIGADGKIKANKSIGGVKLDMSRANVEKKWGKGSCKTVPAGPGTPAQEQCDWSKTIPPSQFDGEYAHVTFLGTGDGATAVIISITAHTRSTDSKVLKGKLSKWETPDGIHLGSKTAKVPEEFPGATTNSSTGVNGFDLFEGARPDLRYTRFTGGIGASASKLIAISLQWDVCHYFDCS